MEVAIIGIGIANPQYKRNQQEASEFVAKLLNLSPAKTRILKSIYKATGIENRYSVIGDYCRAKSEFDFFPNNIETPFPSTAKRMQVYKENALSLVLAAIHNCFNSIDDFNKNEVTHVITVSCTGMYAPGLDIEIVQQLNLNTEIKRFAINYMGCYGAFNAIKMAEAICKAEPYAKVLVVCVELCTIHFQNKTDLDNIIANAIFADGAAAVIIQAVNKKTKCLVLESFYCNLLPQTNKEMAWEIADSGFDIVLSSYVPEIIKSGIANFVKTLLAKTAQTVSDIDFYAIHPGGVKILQACEEALNITQEDNKFSYEVLRHYGNMSSATILFVLKNIFEKLQNGDDQKKIFSCAFGPGLTLESMLLKTHCP